MLLKKKNKEQAWVPRRGGNSQVEQTGMQSEILNLTPKGDHLGVTQAFCDP